MKPSRFAVEMGVIWNRLAPNLTFSVFINKFEKFLFMANINPLKLSNEEYLYWLKQYYEARRKYTENEKGERKI
jgi:hypothetical protein